MEATAGGEGKRQQRQTESARRDGGNSEWGRGDGAVVPVVSYETKQGMDASYLRWRLQ